MVYCDVLMSMTEGIFTTASDQRCKQTQQMKQVKQVKLGTGSCALFVASKHGKLRLGCITCTANCADVYVESMQSLSIMYTQKKGNEKQRNMYHSQPNAIRLDVTVGFRSRLVASHRQRRQPIQLVLGDVDAHGEQPDGRHARVDVLHVNALGVEHVPDLV